MKGRFGELDLLCPITDLESSADTYGVCWHHIRHHTVAAASQRVTTNVGRVFAIAFQPTDLGRFSNLAIQRILIFTFNEFAHNHATSKPGPECRRARAVDSCHLWLAINSKYDAIASHAG